MLATIISATFASSLHLKTVKVIETSLLHSNLGYCNFLYINLLPKQISRLQLLQNSLARAVTGTRTTEHITPVLKSLYWLKIEERIHYKIISYLWPFHHTNQPQCLRILINIKQICWLHSSLWSSYFTSPPASYLKISNRWFNKTAPILWNNLPISLRTFSNTYLILPSLFNVPSYHPHLLMPSFALISKHLFHMSYPL